MDPDSDETTLIVLPKIDINCNLDPNLAEFIHINSPGLFYLRLFDDKEFYSQLTENLNQAYKNDNNVLETNEPLVSGSYWCAYDDKKWNRAKVMKVHQNKNYCIYDMLLIDIGVTKQISLENIRILSDEFTLDPPLAIPCCLHQVLPHSPLEQEPWSQEQINDFYEFCFSSMEFTVIFVRRALNNLFEVIIESSDGTVINEQMSNDGDISQKLDDFITTGSVEPPAVNGTSESPEDLLRLDKWNPMGEDYTTNLNVDSECANTMFMGIKNEDEVKICKFYRRGKPCPNGEVCRFKHITPREDGLPSTCEYIHSQIHTPSTLPEEDSVLPVIVSIVHSPSAFYVQFPNKVSLKLDALYELQQAMNVHYKKSHPDFGQGTTLLSIGQLVAVNNPNSPIKGWNRARVLQTRGLDPVEVEVMYIDIGKEEWIPEEHIRAIIPEFLQLPIQATECWLYGLKPLHELWSVSAKDHFCQFIKGKILVAEVAAVDNLSERLGLIILDNSKEKYSVLNDEMIEKGFALPEEDIEPNDPNEEFEMSR